MTAVAVLGAGPAGLMAAWRAALAGQPVDRRALREANDEFRHWVEVAIAEERAAASA